MIALANIKIQYGGRAVLDDITTTIGERDRVGLVGRNGAGKSTLMKVIAGYITTYSGTISRPSGATIGYLHQDMLMPKGKTVMQETLTAFEEVQALERRLADIHHQLEIRTDYESDSYMDLLTDLSESDERFRNLGGLTMQADAERILTGLGFKPKDFNRLTDEFSGGWQMRIELAKMLLRRPDYILLDEPTNHLDIESILWLEDWLRPYEGAVVVISHDRTFLDNVTKRTIEIELGRMYDYKAPYSKYVELREERREQMINAYNNQQQQIAQTERLIDKFRAKANKAKFAQSLIKQLDRMDRVELDDEDTSAMRIKFPPAPRAGDIVVEIKDLVKRYGEKTILNGIDFQLDRGERVSFVGKNGEGKTTLSKIIVGVENSQGGIVKLGHNVQIGYYAQNQADALQANMTVYDTIEKDAPWEMRTQLRNILGSFLFSGDDIEKKVAVLSGGERARLAMACLLLHPINLLILDEPTNHLDMVSKDVLKEAILRYDGALIVVSHDRDFLTGLTERTVEFNNQKVFNYSGDIQYFLEKRKFDDMRSVSLGKAEEKAKVAAAAAVVSKESANPEEEKKRQKAIQQAEKRVDELEKEKKRIEAKMAETAFYASPDYQKTMDKYNQLKKDLNKAVEEWENLI